MPVSKPRLDAIARSVGIDPALSWASFEHFALRTHRDDVFFNAAARQNASGAGSQYPVNLIPNTTPPGMKPQILFESSERRDNTLGKKSWVAPDGMASLVVARNKVVTESYRNSVFYEAKALTNRTITLDYPPANFAEGDTDELPQTYPSYQILGMLDVLRRSEPRKRGSQASPALMFLTTSDVKIGIDTRARASNYGVGLWHSILCEYPQTQPVSRTNPVKLQMSQLVPLNSNLYLNSGWSPSFGAVPRMGFLLNPNTTLGAIQ